MTVKHFIENVIYPIFNKDNLGCYFKERLKEPVISYYHDYVHLLSVDFTTYEPFKDRFSISLFFYGYEDEYVEGENDILYTVVFKVYLINESFLKLSSKTEEELESVRDFYCVRIHDNNIKEISDKEHIDCFSKFLLKSLGLCDNYRLYKRKEEEKELAELNKLKGEEVF